MYQRVGAAAYKVDLSNTNKLMDHLHGPQLKFKSIHIAGTNGKGSTSHMLASILQEAGYKVGLYTSPHLKDFRERIKINGKIIPKRFVSAFVEKHKMFFEVNELSFFEMTVGLAFDYFSKSEVDIAVVEVGLGGRLDSTNIILPEISVITNIGLDHTRFLGSTIAQIAKEKAGIIKPKVSVIIGETTEETKQIFQEIAEEKDAPISFAESLNDSDLSKYYSDLGGNYQRMNRKTVIATIQALRAKGWKISEESVMLGFRNTVLNTGLMGRWQVLQTIPKVICDTAHNKEGLTLVMDQLLNENYRKLHIVLGSVDDKDLNSILPLFPKDAIYYFCKPSVPRGLTANSLKAFAVPFGLKGRSFLTVKLAYKNALKSAAEKDIIFVGGSTFVIAEVL